MPLLTAAKYLDPASVILGSAYPGATPVGDIEATAPGYTLTRRQEHLYRFRADLFKPVELDTSDDQSVSDQAWKEPATASAVPCWKRESQEENQASPVGRTNYDIALTIDQFTFPSGVTIDDGWLIKLYSPDPEELVGAEAMGNGQMQNADDGPQFYIVQGGAQDRPAVNRRQANQRKVFGVKTSAPVSHLGQFTAGGH